jgi:hypothetical protein
MLYIIAQSKAVARPFPEHSSIGVPSQHLKVTKNGILQRVGIADGVKSCGCILTYPLQAQ